MVDRNSANLRNIATTGFDQPLSLNSLAIGDHGHSQTVSSSLSHETESSEPATSHIDHPKLTAAGVYFLKGVDLFVPSLSGEFNFAENLANRNNPTTIENIHRKLTKMPPNYSTFTKDQKEAFCKLVDFAEMKQALRLELKLKEKVIREQEMKYLTTDYGLGNVVHGWDITNPSGATGNERQTSSNRLVTRRKVKDSDRIFSSSSVMSFLTSTRISRTKRIETMKKKKRNREKLEKERKKQQNLQKRRLNAFREDRSIDTEDSFADENYALSGRESEVDEEEISAKKSHKKKQITTVKKQKKLVDVVLAGKISPQTTKIVPRMTKLIPPRAERPDKPASETGHRLRTLLTNKTPHTMFAHGGSNSGNSGGNSNSGNAGGSGGSGGGGGGGGESGSLPTHPKEPIKIKIMKSRLMEAGASDVPTSPAPSAVTVDSGSETPDTPSTAGGVHKRNRGRPKRLET